MEEIIVHYQDGSDHPVARGSTILELAARLCPDALAASLNGRVVDLTTPLEASCELRLYTFEDRVGQQTLWHTASHVMAQAVVELFPGTKLGIGPAIEEGFYYDFDTPKPLSQHHLEKIEERMREIAARDLPLVREEISREEAIRLFEGQDAVYKVELLREMEPPITIYRQGTFVDVCRGPHLPSTGRVKAIKLMQVAGAYWRGDENRPMLQRIYGIAFPREEQLVEYLRMLEEAAKRDHRKIGKEMELFAFFPEAGIGLPFYLPKGTIIRNTIEQFLLEEHRKRGYQLVWTPHIYKAEIWERSGHLAKGFGMFFTEVDGHRYGIKPMNCPGHILIYSSQRRSYRELPVRYFELGTVYRAEQTGVAQGLLRVRCFTQDDAHIFCTPDQLDEEIAGVLNFATDMLHTFGMRRYDFYLSTRPEQSLGSDEIWERATNALIGAMQKRAIPYKVDPGAGIFYGPKIDVQLYDALGRPRQGPTIQVDFNEPEQFDLTYVDSDNQLKRPVMIHRVVLAGLDRFFGLLIEHYAGHFPLWLAPVQARVLPVSERVQDYAETVHRKLVDSGIRSELDARSDTVSYRVRDAEVQRVPLIVVVGPREQEQETVTLRRCGQQRTLSLAAFIAQTQEEIMEKKTAPEAEQ